MEIFSKTKGRALKKEASKAIFLCMLLLLVITTVIGLSFYIYSYLRGYKHEMNSLASYTLSQFEEGYLEQLFEDTEKVYDSIPEEIRKDAFTDEYRAYLTPLVDKKYLESRDKLIRCRENTSISNIYFGFYDLEYERLVIVLDGDIQTLYYYPGQYISNVNGSLDSWDAIVDSINSDWRMSFDYTSLVGLSATDYYPIFTPDDKLMGIVGIDTNIEYFEDDLLVYIILVIPALLIAFGMLMVFLSGTIDKMIITPVQNLAKAAKSFTSRDKVNETDSTCFFSDVTIESAQEFVELKDSMVDMENDINQSIKEIKRVSAEKERLAAEMEIASTIQQAALPAGFPDRPEFDLHATMTPAKDVAGDFYDFFMLDDDHMVMIIADVSGKGVPAALFMMKGKELLKNLAIKGGKPSEILAEAGNQLAVDNETSMFITIWLGILEISTGIITAANAGHEFPFVMGEDGVYTKFADPHGVVCGAIENCKYKDYTITLPKGGALFLYTDGVPEAMNMSDEYYGLGRIGEALNKADGKLTSKELIAHIKKDIDTFAGDREQYDDITMMCLIMNR